MKRKISTPETDPAEFGIRDARCNHRTWTEEQRIKRDTNTHEGFSVGLRGSKESSSLSDLMLGIRILYRVEKTSHLPLRTL